MEITKKYLNDELTVVWKPKLCIHSGKCVKALPEVFKPQEKPWIQLEPSNNADIIDAIKSCPSGALSYYLNDIGETRVDKENIKEMTRVEVLKDGPLMVYGTLEIMKADGKQENRSKSTAFSRCGQTGNSPFCDGSHVN